MVMCYNKGKTHSWAYKGRENLLRVVAVAKSEKIEKIGEFPSLLYPLPRLRA